MGNVSCLLYERSRTDRLVSWTIVPSKTKEFGGTWMLSGIDALPYSRLADPSVRLCHLPASRHVVPAQSLPPAVHVYGAHRGDSNISTEETCDTGEVEAELRVVKSRYPLAMNHVGRAAACKRSIEACVKEHEVSTYLKKLVDSLRTPHRQ